MGHGPWSVTWHHGHAGKVSCPCRVSHTTPPEAYAPREIGHPWLPPTMVFPESRDEWEPLHGIWEGASQPSPWSRSAAFGDEMGENGSLLFLTLPDPLSPLSSFSVCRCRGEAQGGHRAAVPWHQGLRPGSAPVTVCWLWPGLVPGGPKAWGQRCAIS